MDTKKGARQEHRKYPYLLRDLVIDRPNQVWCSDITYIPMHKGFLYLVAVMDWHAHKVLFWRLSNTMDAEFCIEALRDALVRYSTPEIFNTDQGSQFTTLRFTEVLERRQVRFSMDGRGRWLDNVFIECLWRYGSPIIMGSVRTRHWLDARLMRRIMTCRRHLVRG
ncbi:transposase [Komagataeibacter saccharivorans NRIC 0614]|nr:transposase [Komagataeibacter saccharivorans NRIC 0614]